ncbi:Zn-dependent peptidase ImmA, M78 family [Micromonospora nigra]|uniref:Zn-dependent peptidase ImmA, M78 family n=1 Tax=Micromonospora nigra TaxID=145857 RepID=A0A1C6RW23_9ACTN|nr:XRE family transcriptional regulator [Micromonospora nigra]SCL21230.1 Zn-dependent peptidase ImmA, M78 family [Micromonospora nigra]
MKDFEQLTLVQTDRPRRGNVSASGINHAFDGSRLTQARQLAGWTKSRLAEEIGVTSAAVGQYELGVSRPRPELISRMGEKLGVPTSFFLAGRPHARLDASKAHFRSLRATRSYQRAKAVSFTEIVWELSNALERRVQLPPVNLPEMPETIREPRMAARIVRQAWGLGDGPISHLVRRIESHGIVATTPPPDPDARSVDAFSTSATPRPIIVLTPNRADNVYRHRFSAAHELGHIVLHGEAVPGDLQQEREADAFAAEFLTPRESIIPQLPKRVDLGQLADLQLTWGVSVKSLLYRSREVGLLSDSAASRAFQRLQAVSEQPGFRGESIAAYTGEQPAMLSHAFALARKQGLTVAELAEDLSWPTPWVRSLLGMDQMRPVLKLVK